MSKTVGKVLMVAAIVATIAAPFIAPLTAALITAGVAAASFVNSAVLASRAAGANQQRQASVTALQIGEVSREAIFGTAMTGGSLVDAFNYGGAQGTDWECYVIALADHRCESLVGFYVNDQFVSFGGDGAVAGYSDQLVVHWRPGTMDQAVPAILLANGPGWTAEDNGAGVAYVVVAFKADKADTKTPVWTAGRPRFTWVVKGKRCYQARLDSSVGGSGAHRWADPATWAWTDNPIDCRYNWVRGVYAGDRVDEPGQLLVGRGLSPIEAPPTNVFAPANVCDEAVALDAGGSEKRYRTSGVIRADEAYIEVEEHFAAACGGVILQPEGAVEIEPGQAKAPVFFFSDDDLLVGSSVQYSEDLSDADAAWVNTVVPRYVEPSLKYADHAAPIRRVVGDIIADGGPREQPLSLSLVTSATQAGRVGEIGRRMGRLWKRAQVTLGPAFAEVEEGDWGVWTSQRYLKGESVMFRVEAYGLDEKWHNTLTLREIATAVFAKDFDAASTSVALQQDVPAIGQPGPDAWVATSPATTPANPLPTVVVIGAADTDYAELVRFEYALAAGVVDPTTIAVWTEATLAGPDARRAEINAVAPETAYYVAVSYVVGRVPGARRILGPVTTDTIEVVGEPGRDGVSAYAILLTNEAHILPAAADGSVITYNGASTSFAIYFEGEDVTANFALSVASNPQALAIGLSGSTATVTGGLDVGEPNGIVLLRMTGSGAFAEVVLDRQFSLTKSRAGADGASAKLIFLASTHQTISLDGAGSVQDQTTIFTATRQNSGTGRTVWRLLNGDGSPRTNFDYASVIAPAIGATRISDDVVTMTAAEMNARMTEVSTPALIFEVRLDNDAAIADRISVVRVQAGAPGSDAALVTVQASTTQVRYDGAGGIEAQDVAFTATRQNSTAGVLWSTYGLNGAELDSPKPAADFVAADPVGWSSAGPDQLTRTAAGLNGIIVAGGGGFAVEARLDGTTIAQRVTVTKVQDGAAATGGGDTGLGLLADGATTIIIPASDLDWQNVVETDVTVQAGRKFRLTLAGSNASYTPEDTGGGPVIGGPDAIARIEITLTGGGTTLALFAGNVSIDAAGTLESSALVAASMAFITNTITGPATLTIRRRREVGPGNDASFTLNYGLERL